MENLKNFISNINDAKKSKNSVLFLTYVHGDEPAGYKIVKLLKSDKSINKNFDWLIANPVAAFQSKRFIDADLNRSAPGDRNAKEYEIRRASELVEIIKKYKYVVDLHQTRANNKIIAIMPEISIKKLKYLCQFDVDNILIWPPKKNLKTGPLIQNIPYSIGIETGTKNGYGDRIEKLSKILKEFLIRIKNNDLKYSNEKLSKKNFYFVYGKIESKDISSKDELKDFKEIKGKKESFIALLFGRHKKILGYKMKKVGLNWIKNKI